MTQQIKVTVDPKSGFCFGVVYAIEMAENILREENKLYCLEILFTTINRS